jgi:transposase-like protein
MREFCLYYRIFRAIMINFYSTNSIESMSVEIKFRTYIISIFPDEAAATIRLIGTILLEQNDEWNDQRVRYMTLEAIAPLGDDPHIMLPIVAA